MNATQIEVQPTQSQVALARAVLALCNVHDDKLAPYTDQQVCDLATVAVAVRRSELVQA